MSLIETAKSLLSATGVRIPGISTFADTQGSSAAVIILALVLLVVYVLVLLLVGKWLFNNTLCSLFSGVRPATSVWQILGLWFLLHLLLP